MNDQERTELLTLVGAARWCLQQGKDLECEPKLIALGDALVLALHHLGINYSEVPAEWPEEN
jgi:hypothetical protein